MIAGTFGAPGLPDVRALSRKLPLETGYTIAARPAPRLQYWQNQRLLH
jgi:hypothetical protein